MLRQGVHLVEIDLLLGARRLQTDRPRIGWLPSFNEQRPEATLSRMNRVARTIEQLSLAACACLLLAGAPASQPVLDRTIASGQYHLASPPSPEWTTNFSDPAAEAILFVNTNHDGAIQIELLPKDANLAPDVVGSMTGAILKELRRQRAVNHTVVVMAPKVEHDRRFTIFIHEKYKVEDKTCDERYAYKAVGPRVLLLSVYSLSDDADTTASIHKTGESVLESVKFDRKAFKKIVP